jgi:hypothetical protein
MFTRKLLTVAAAGALIVATPLAAEAKPRSNTFRFTGSTNVSSLNITCAPGAEKGTTPTKLKVKATRHFNKHVTDDFIGNSLGQATKFVASYPGGSLVLARFETFYTINANKSFKFPCPPNTGSVHPDAVTSQFVISIQPFKGDKKIGTPAQVEVKLRRVGSSS